MESFATPYPVLFYDGEQEHDKGHVGVHSVLSFKRFQALMAQKTGIPANQLSAVFVCRRTLKDTEKRQKLPINENTNFNIILNQHNPSRERDCHFLVSMKKSKKERKGTRKRSTEAENADDDDSTSSRGELSPSDERPKAGSADETFSPEATSPRSFVARPLSPAISLSSNGISPAVAGSGSPGGKLPVGAPEYKVERTLLRREAAGSNGFASPRSGWGAATIAQRVEGFSVPNGAAGKAETLTAQLPNAAGLQQEARRNVDKQWRQSSPTQDQSVPLRPNEKVINHSAGQSQLLLPSPGLDFFHQDRFNDAIAPGNDMRSPSARPVGTSPVLQRNSVISASSSNARPAMSPISPSPGGAFIPRGSMGSLAAVAQVHISHMQQQNHTSLHSGMSQLEMSKLNGMLRGLVGRDSRPENSKICKFCLFLRDRNIGPPPFHWCVDDAITKGFRGPSPAGPIGRPVKRHVEAAA